MPRWLTVALMATMVLAGCQSVLPSATRAPGRDAPLPPTWTPTARVEDTPTATRVVQPTPTWDGTPPPPSFEQVPRMPPARLDRFLRGDTPKGLEAGVTIVDVRSLAAYEQAHLPGARQIPLEELPERVGELDGRQTIVFYVLSSSESGALQAAMMLYGLGFADVAVLEGGIQRWYADGYEIEGTWLTPTPDELGPPWTLTPLGTSVEATLAAAETAAVTMTPTLRAGPESPDTPSPTLPTKQAP